MTAATLVPLARLDQLPADDVFPIKVLVPAFHVVSATRVSTPIILPHQGSDGQWDGM